MSAITIGHPLQVAEDALAYVSPWPCDELDDQGDLVLSCVDAAHRQAASVLRVRLDDASVEGRIADVRAWMAAHSRQEFTWSLGASTTPSDLGDRLLALGAEPDPDDPILIPMALDHEPSGAAGVVAVPVTTLADYVRCRELMFDGFELPENLRVSARERSERDWVYARNDGIVRFQVRLGGEPAAYGVLMPLLVGPPFLAAAVVAPQARGRGAYRALLRARWDAAVAMGAKAVVALADARSVPVLEHFGLRSGPPVRLLVDRACARET
jgi:GNAT superfamily N-acetyltransferase